MTGEEFRALEIAVNCRPASTQCHAVTRSEDRHSIARLRDGGSDHDMRA
jgi:hypothetical protein